MIGEDTNIIISKEKLAKEISISSNKDEIKNCFRVEGGDDLITAMVAAINMNGTNYIYRFANFQLDDMSDELREKIASYQTMMEQDSASYYGENGIYMRLCNAYEEKLYKESGMMPEVTIEVGTAQDEYNKLLSNLQNSTVAVSQLNKYSSTLFAGVNNNIEAYANILIDSRFDLEIYGDPTYTKVSDEKYKWSGKFRITQHTDETNVYPVDMDAAQTFTVYVNEDELTFAKQKCDKALYKVDLSTMDTDTYNMSDSKLEIYLEQYCLASLKSFYDGLDTCISTLLELGSDEEDSPTKVLYNKYYNRKKITEKIYNQRQKEIDSLTKLIESIEDEQIEFQKNHDFQSYLGDKLYLEFCTYRREDTYSNSNYISDSIEDDTSACLNKAKELIEVATKEMNKACMLQHTVSTSVNNLLLLPEFKPLYDKFALYNYIRVRTDDEILKLRLIGIDFNGDDWSDVSVTFSDQIEYIDGAIDTTTAILKQASSMSSSYSSTTLQAKQGSEAKSIFNEIYANGLNAANAMLKNSDNNEVTISASGIVAKRMDDEGFYGDKQLRVIGNCIAMTYNNWETVAMAIGEITFTDPITNVTSQKYGVIADAIVGNMIVGQNMVIGNDKGTVSITGEGITIYDGQGVADENKVFYADNNGNLTLKAHVEASSGKIANFNISTSALYTDGAQYGSKGLYFGSSGLSLGGGFKVDSSGNITSTGTLSIANGNLTYSSTNGLVVKGNVQATSGKIANFNINTSSLYTDGATFANTTGIYLGSSGLRIGSGFKVDTNGNITSSGTLSMAGGNLTYSSANGLVVKGNIQASGGSIKIGNNFSVDTSGNMSCINASVTGNIHGTFIKASKAYYIYDSDAMSYTQVISVSLDNSSDTRYNFGRLTNNGYGSGLNYITFIDQSQDRSCIIYSDNTTIKGALITSDAFIGNIDISGNTIYSNGNMTLENEDGGLGFYSTAFRPQSSYKNTLTLGTATNYWNAIYSKDGKIGTSDRNLKHHIQDLSEKYKQLFFKIKPCTYVFKDGVRTHIGAISQDIENALKEVGLSALEFAGFCKDQKTKDIIDEDGTLREELVFDVDGNPEYVYALRYEEFIMLNTHMLQEAYKIIETQQKDIDELKASILNNK